MTNSKTKWIAGVVIVVIIFFLIIFLSASKSNISTVKIGAVLPLTGPAGSTGELVRAGLQWKIDDLKSAGRNIDFIISDSQSDPKQAVSAFNKLTEIDGTKIIFTVSSAAGMNLRPIAEQRDVLLWGDISHPGFTKDSIHLLRHSNIVDQQTEVVADHIIAQGFRSVGIIYQQDDFGVAYNSLLTSNLQSKGIRVASESVDQKSTDFRTQIAKVRTSKPEAMVFAIVGPGAGILIKQSKEAGYTGAIYESVGFILTPAAQEIAGDLAKGIYYEGYADNQQFIDEYTKKFGKIPPTLAVIGYTDIELLFDAIDKTGSVEPAKLLAYIKSLGSFEGRFEKVNITPQGDIVVPVIVKVW